MTSAISSTMLHPSRPTPHSPFPITAATPQIRVPKTEAKDSKIGLTAPIIGGNY